jgi:hypothetical protein
VVYRTPQEIEVAGLRASGFSRDPSCVEALGALNRWPSRSALPIEDYLRQWLASAPELGASPILPTRIRRKLGFDLTPLRIIDYRLPIAIRCGAIVVHHAP